MNTKIKKLKRNLQFLNVYYSTPVYVILSFLLLLCMFSPVILMPISVSLFSDFVSEVENGRLIFAITIAYDLLVMGLNSLLSRLEEKSLDFSSQIAEELIKEVGKPEFVSLVNKYHNICYLTDFEFKKMKERTGRAFISAFEKREYYKNYYNPS